MARVTRHDIRLFSLIVLPIAVAMLGMHWGITRILDGISESVNRQEAARTWQAVQAAFASAEDRLAGTVVDNAHWDDAAVQAYGPIDDKWMYDTWGIGTADINYDTMYIVDARGTAITSFHRGEPFKLSAERFFGGSLTRTLHDLPKDNATFAVVSSLIKTPDGLALMAAAPILPTSDDIKIPTDKAPRYLILATTLTDNILEKLSQQYVVDNLTLTPAVVAGAHNLKDRWGSAVAAVNWQERHPGEAARQSYSFSALLTTLALIGVMVPISLVHARTISNLERQKMEARTAARVDALSGLPNRVLLTERLTEALGPAQPPELALMFVDLDGFKAVNDTYDHETGDKLIRAVAAGLTYLLGNQGIAARLGGDEFAVLISGDDARRKAELMAHRILAFVKEPFDIDGRIANIGASIGIAAIEREVVEPTELMRRADIAMYDAKIGGRNRWRHFDVELDRKRSEDQAIAKELRSLIADGDFEVAYQPMIDSRNRAVAAVEALARWPRSSKRQLEPNRFIPIAEEYGLIDSLGALVLQIACRDVMQWQDLHLAINVSPVQINNPQLVPDIQRIANEAGLRLERLEIELTETTLIRNPRRAKQVIHDLQTLGVMVSLDDFGTGYASVGYLREYGFDKIKLDRSLTLAVATDSAAQQVVQGTILIAKGLCANVIAEGVETEEQAQLLRLAGCQQLQGYYFGHPQSVNAMHGILADAYNRTPHVKTQAL